MNTLRRLTHVDWHMHSIGTGGFGAANDASFRGTCDQFQGHRSAEGRSYGYCGPVQPSVS